jgi:hypothetical protein
VVGVVAELAAQVGDVHLHQMLITHPLGSPGPLQQLAAAEHDPRPLRQRLQQIELQAGQLHRVAAAADLAGGHIHAQIPEAAHRRRLGPGGAGSPAHGPDARHQLPRGERLGHVVVGAGGQAHDLVGLLGPGGEHDDVGVTEGPDLPAGLDAVHAGKHQVQHDHLGILLPDQLDGSFAILTGADREPLTFQIAGDQPAQRRLVLDYQRTRLRGGRLPTPRVRAATTHGWLLRCGQGDPERFAGRPLEDRSVWSLR